MHKMKAKKMAAPRKESSHLIQQCNFNTTLQLSTFGFELRCHQPSRTIPYSLSERAGMVLWGLYRVQEQVAS